MDLRLVALLLIFKLLVVHGQYYDDQVAPDDWEDGALTDVSHRADISSEYKEKVVVFNGNVDRKLPNLEFVFGSNDVRLVTANCSAIVLNGTELYSLAVQRDRGTVMLQQLGQLANVDEPIADIHYKKNEAYTLIMVALQSHYQVYVLFNDRYNGLVRPIEKIAMNGVHQRMLMFSQSDSWYCLVGNALSNELGTTSSMRIFKWRQSHFTLLDQYTVTLIRDVRMCKTADAKTLIMVVGNDQADEVNASLEPLTLVQVYVFAQDRLRHVQNMHTNWATLYTFFMDGRCVLVSMPDQRSGLLKSEVYVWDDNFHLLTDNQPVLFDDMVTNEYDLIVIQNLDNLTAFTVKNLRRGQSAERKVDPNVQIVMLVEENQLYIALSKRNVNESSVVYNIELLPIATELVTRNSDVGASNPSESSEQCFKDLDKSIKDRKAVIDELQSTLLNRLRKDQDSNITVLRTEKAYAQAASFDLVHINITNYISVSSLRQSIEKLKSNILGHSHRIKRSAKNASSISLHEVIANSIWINNSQLSTALLKNKRVTLQVPTQMNVIFADRILFQPNATRTKRRTKNISNINNLSVQKINDIDWPIFVSSLYSRNNPLAINGNLVIAKPCSVQNAQFAIVNAIPVSSFFTLTTAQTVHSQVLFSRVNTADLQANTTNELRIPADVALTHGNQQIEGPVVLAKCSIGALELSELDSRSEFARHIVGTRLEDLSQIYSGQVIINGTLRLANVRLDRRGKSNLFVSGQRFDILGAVTQFWLSGVDQHVGNVIFQRPVRTTQLLVDAINASPVDDYLSTASTAAGSANLVLSDATIRGNLFTDTRYRTILAQISERCVRRGENNVRLTGRKLFSGKVSIQHYRNRNVEHMRTLAALKRNEIVSADPLKLNCVKHFNQLTAMGDMHVTSDQLEVAAFNGVNLMDGFANMVRVHEASTLDDLHIVGTVRTKELTLSVLDSENFETIASSIANVVGRYVLHVGDPNAVSSIGDLVVGTINGIEVTEYFARLITTSGPELVKVSGVKRFLGGLTTQSMSIGRLNDLPVKDWFASTLHSGRQQELSGQWNISALRAQTLWSPDINGMQLAQLINCLTDTVEIRSDIRLAQDVTVVGEIVAAPAGCDLTSACATLISGVIASNWHTIEISGLATWPTANQLTPINRLYAQAVLANADQFIAGNVIFRPSAAYVQHWNSSLPVNDIDVQALLVDALLSTGDFQAIRGVLRFANGITLTQLLTEHDINAPIWNGCSVQYVNASLFRDNVHNLITGRKRFRQSPRVQYLRIVSGHIAGIPIADAICANRSGAEPLPVVAWFSAVHIRTNLQISDTLNYMPLPMMSNRLRARGVTQDIRGVLTFENLIVRGGPYSRISTINGIAAKDIVIRSTDVPQSIGGRKRIHGVLQLRGPVVVTRLNGVDLVPTYSNSIGLDAAQHLPLLKIAANITLNGSNTMQILGQLNDADILEMMYWQPTGAEDLRPMHTELRTAIDRSEQALRSALIADPKTIHFLDYTDDIRIRFVADSRPPATGELSVFIDTRAPCSVGSCMCPMQNEIVAFTRNTLLVNRRALYERNINLPGRNGNFTVHTQFERVSCDTTAAKDAEFTAIVSGSSMNGSSELLRTSVGIRDVKLFEQDAESVILINYANGTVQVWRRRTNELGLAVFSNDGFIEYPQQLAGLFILRWQNYNLLLVLSAQQVHRPNEAQLFYFDGMHFRPLANGAISGDFDLCDSLYYSQQGDLMLWLGKMGSDVISVYKSVIRDGLLGTFRLLQTIVVNDGLVRSIIATQLIDSKCMIVLTENDFMVLYRFNHLTGWIRSADGYFKDIEYVQSLQYSQRDYLYVSMQSASVALRVFSSDR